MGVAYRQKCICPDGALHDLDIYCPLNILLVVEGDQSDNESTESQKIEKEKKQRRMSPPDSDSGSHDSEIDEINSQNSRSKKQKNMSPFEFNYKGLDPEREEVEMLKAKQEKDENRRKAVGEIMSMIGIENIKDFIHTVTAKIETSTRQGADLGEERFGTIFLGNPGTGW